MFFFIVVYFVLTYGQFSYVKKSMIYHICIVDAVTSSRILKAKQKLGITLNFDKHFVIDFTKISNMTIYAVPQKQIHKSSHRSIVWGQKDYKGLLFFSKLKKIYSSNKISW